MVTAQYVDDQLKRLGFNVRAWGRKEVRELQNILIPDEEMYECVNGIYEGGFALLVATNIRVLLVDKKPLNYLTVEDLRFDMINEIDYSHRLTGAHITISAGLKNLKFRSYNQPRLRKLINHVQHCIAESKKQQSQNQQGQNQHLEQINQQLQAYLFAQQRSQQELNERLREAQQQGAKVEPLPPQAVQPSPELADYLFAQSLLFQHERQQAAEHPLAPQSNALPIVPLATRQTVPGQSADSQLADLYAEGLQEVFGKRQQLANTQPSNQPAASVQPSPSPMHLPLEINALRIAYSKLPMALRNRKFGRPSFHAHSQAANLAPPTPAITNG